MQRIPFVAKEDMPPNLSEREISSSIWRLMAHAPTVAPVWRRLGEVIFAGLELDPMEREIACLAAVHLERGEYEWVQHVVKGEGLGMSREQIDAISRDEFANPVFNARQKALLAYVKQVVTDVRVDDATFAAAREHFSYRELVEIIFTCGAYMTLARITENARIPPDPPTGMGPIHDAAVRFAAAQAEATR